MIYRNYGIVDTKIKKILLTSGDLKRIFNQSLAIIFTFLKYLLWIILHYLMLH